MDQLNDSKIRFAEAIHNLSSEAQESVVFLKMLVDHPELHPTFKIRMHQILVTITTMEQVLRGLTEEQLTLEERIIDMKKKGKP